MLGNIWNTVLYHPLINALAFLVSIIPGGDVGIAVILLTILVKIGIPLILLYYLSKKNAPKTRLYYFILWSIS